MNELQVFKNQEFGSVRTLVINSEPWFVGKDVAEALGYGAENKKSKALTNAIKDHVGEEDKRLMSYEEFKGYRNGDLKNISHYGVTIINESGLYALIFGSKLESAQKFKRWVTSEVLPALRKTGQYQVKELSGSELMAKALIEAQNVLAAKDKQIEEMKPKALFADAVATSHTSILVGELAKILKQNGIDMGQKRLFAWLREKGYLIKRQGTDYNMPTQKAMELGLFEIKEGSYVNGSGVNITTKTPKITGKGQQYFINKFLQQEVIIMDEWSISVEEVMRITKKSRDFILNAIEQGVMPGSVVTHDSGKRSTYIPRKAFMDYMNNYYRAPSDKLIAAVVEELTKRKTIE